MPARISDPAWALAVGLPPGGYLGFFSGMFLHGGFCTCCSTCGRS
ncbi:MAG: hypothetical protein R2862_05575 [Thermoanaerobaculia bacterium]